MLILTWLTSVLVIASLINQKFVRSFLYLATLFLALKISIVFVLLSLIASLDAVHSTNSRDKKYYVAGLSVLLVLVEVNVYFVAIILALMLVLLAYRAFKYRFKSATNLLDEDLPTVTLAIPARNEDHALTDALLAAVASDYPKLEVIVLDDCSQDKTAQIIRSFAHSGVRFVQGSPPPNGWLGKNWAYKKLSEEASGDYVLFCGVDVILDRYSIKNLIEYLKFHKLQMLSVLPKRRHLDLGSSLLQPMRYLWQLCLPKKLYPPALSTAWIIEAKLLNEKKLDQLKGEIIPESNIAKELKKAYRFIFSNHQLGINTRKRISSQIDTSTRTAYPMLLKSPLLTFITSILIFNLFIFPLFDLSEVINVVIVALGALLQIGIFLIVRPKTWFLGLIQMPLSASLYIYTLLKGFLQYESGNVEWKGRNICIPVYDQES